LAFRDNAFFKAEIEEGTVRGTLLKKRTFILIKYVISNPATSTLKEDNKAPATLEEAGPVANY